MAGQDASDDDAAPFRAAIGRVRELPAAPDAPAKPRPAPSARMAQRDEAQARSEFQRMLDGDGAPDAGDVIAYRRDEVPPHVLRRLARGDYAARDELDLHGANAARAESLIRTFLHEARASGAGCVRIVHGKGMRSDDGRPVLKALVDRMLRQRADVLAFHSAPPAQGGTGAVLALLRPR